jgi:hypothetical protein
MLYLCSVEGLGKDRGTERKTENRRIKRKCWGGGDWGSERSRRRTDSGKEEQEGKRKR